MDRDLRLTSMALCCSALLAFSVSACSSPRDPHRVAISVSTPTALDDQPFTTTVTGLHPAQEATLRLSTTASDGMTWTSAATFKADPTGRFSTSQSPTNGSYHSTDPMGLTETLSPGHGDATFHSPARWTMTETVVVDGKAVSTIDVSRQHPADQGINTTTERVAGSGVSGELYLPASRSSSPSPAVVVFGGSEGGLSTSSAAATLAAHGYPALALAYFGAPDLPANLESIPLEYFAHAARLLAGQPGVDARRLVLWGTSRGSEAALLTAAHYPQLVHGVIASVPSGEAFPGLPNIDKPAWTFNGKAVPTARPTLLETADAPATIHVEQISGPILLVCGGQDKVWASCANSDVIATRLTSHHRPNPTLLSYPAAGHFVGSLLPYQPSTLSSGRTASGIEVQSGGSFPADQAARAEAWPKTLEYLHILTR